MRYLRTTLDLCLLALIESGDSYGYELTDVLRARGYPVEGVRSVYPILKRFESQELVESYLVPSSAGPARKYYRITDDGRTALRRRAAYRFGLFEMAKEIVTERVEL